MENPSTAIVLSQKQVSYQEAKDFAQIAVDSKYFLSKEITNPAKAMALIMIGRELGLGPAASLRGVYLIEGVPSLSARVMSSLINLSGNWRTKLLQWTHSVAEIQFLRRENGTWVPQTPTMVFTIEDAKRAGYIKPKSGWEKTPRNMLYARALSNGFNIFCPELACGMPIYAVADEELPDRVESHYSPDKAVPDDLPPEAEFEPRNTPRETAEVPCRICREDSEKVFKTLNQNS
jgi:hypothetical protein